MELAREREILFLRSVDGPLFPFRAAIFPKPRVFQGSGECSPSQINSGVLGKSNRELGQYAERLSIAFEPVLVSAFPDKTVEGFFSDVPKRRMPEIVREASSLDNFGIEAMRFGKLRLLLLQCLSQPAPDLSNLHAMLKASVEDISFPSPHNLSDAGKPLKSG
jgi:hypothetical protein